MIELAEHGQPQPFKAGSDCLTSVHQNMQCCADVAGCLYTSQEENLWQWRKWNDKMHPQISGCRGMMFMIADLLIVIGRIASLPFQCSVCEVVIGTTIRMWTGAVRLLGAVCHQQML